MSKEIFPVDIVENTQESNFERHNVRLRIVNWTILFAVILGIGILPLIETDVGLRSHGFIRPVTELVQITSPVSGKLQELNITENSRLDRGEVIAQINPSRVSEQIRHIRNREMRLSLFLQDLGELIQLHLTPPTHQPELKTARYTRSLLEIRHHITGFQREISRHKKELERQQYLYDRELTSSVSLEEAEFNLQDARNRLELAVEQQKNRWHAEKLDYQNELEELQVQRNQYQQDLEMYTIRSPVSGAVQNLAAIHQNSYVHPNQVLAEISPDTGLVAAVYVLPNNIGLLREGMPVRFSIDAYDQNQWGTIEGTILNIPSDAMMMEQTPVFRVLCSVDRTYLELQNGVRGELKKGMTLQARFIVARRTLLQLLFDNVDDWFNPVWNNNTNQGDSSA